MKVPTWLAMVAATTLPVMAVAQQYQISQTAPPGGFNQPAASVLPQPNAYAPSPAPRAAFPPPAANQAVPTPAAYPAVPTPQPMHAAPMAAPAPGVGHVLGDYGGGCDAGGCDAGGYPGYGMGGGVMDGGSMMSGDCGAGCGSDGFVDAGFSGGCGGGLGCLAGGGGCGSAGRYFMFIGGGSELDSQVSSAPSRLLEVDYNQGYAVGGAIGRRVGRNLRSEIEYVFRSQTAEVGAFNLSPTGLDGNQNSHAAMLNFAYDLVFGQGRIVPYIGAGIGVAAVDSRVTVNNAGVSSFFDGDDSSVAYQWMAGISFRARPNLEMFAEYRFFEIDDPKVNFFGPPAIGGAFAPNVLLNSEYVSNDIMFGFRFNF